MGFTSKYTGAQIEGYLDAVAEINSVIESNEKVTAAAINDLKNTMGKLPTDDKVDAKIVEAIDAVKSNEIEAINTSITDLTNEIISNEKVTAAAINDVNARIDSLAESIVNTINADF